MQTHIKFKHFSMLLLLVLMVAWCSAATIHSIDGYSAIQVKEAYVTGAPKGSTIQASINGHTLTVVFTENLGQVDIEVTTSTGGYVQANSCITPNGIQFYIPNAGDYIVTFTLSNGDMYAGEFTVSD